MESIDPVLLVSRWLHLAAAIVALGGALFMRLAVHPSAREVLGADEHERLREALRRRWAPLVHSSIAILFLTGLFNFYWLAIRPKVPPIPYHPIFGVKLLAALFVFFVAEALVGTAPGFARMRERRAKWLSVILVLGGIIVLLSGGLNQLRTQNQRGAAPVASAP